MCGESKRGCKIEKNKTTKKKKPFFSLYVIWSVYAISSKTSKPELMKPLFVCWTMMSPSLLKHCGSCREAGHTVAENVFVLVSLAEVSSSLFLDKQEGQSAIGYKTPHLHQHQPTMLLVLNVFVHFGVLIWSVPFHMLWLDGGEVSRGETSWNISGHAIRL